MYIKLSKIVLTFNVGGMRNLFSLFFSAIGSTVSLLQNLFPFDSTQ
jgi:hypothetical protein